MQAAQWVHEAAPYHTYWISLWVEKPLVCRLWHLLFLLNLGPWVGCVVGVLVAKDMLQCSAG